MSSWNLLGKGYEKIPLLASANLWGDYHGIFWGSGLHPLNAALRRRACHGTAMWIGCVTAPTAPA
ncbi:hypothetical protein J7361_19175, partial [Xanthomonas phaseoli pv. dieffenbachiae]|uniref:hypothetical protein n=1 Tax=Xanthomonas phaseoli TaxID=1985254 RepID=UPI001ADA49EB